MSKNTNLSFLTDYITADITNGRIGINTPSPAYAFDVTGIARTSTSTYLATASGNVGIGTTSPAYKLHIAGVAANNIFYMSDTTGYAIHQLSNTGGNFYFAIDSSTGGAFGNGAYTRHLYSNGAYPIVITTNDVERMRITSGGNVGIGTSSPAQRLSVQGVANNWTANIIGSTTAGQSLGLLVTSGLNNNDVSFLVQKSDSSATYFTIRGDGLMSSIPTYNNTYGNVANTYIGADGFMGRSTASSQRFKDNISDWGTNGLDTILALKPRTYTYKKDYYSQPNRKFLGLIAEEVAEVSHYLADFQNEDGSGEVENVRYATIVVPLIAAIQELKAEIETLKNK